MHTERERTLARMALRNTLLSTSLAPESHTVCCFSNALPGSLHQSESGKNHNPHALSLSPSFPVVFLHQSRKSEIPLPLLSFPARPRVLPFHLFTRAEVGKTLIPLSPSLPPSLFISSPERKQKNRNPYSLSLSLSLSPPIS